jgi:hypothetical protein
MPPKHARTEPSSSSDATSLPEYLELSVQGYVYPLHLDVLAAMPPGRLRSYIFGPSAKHTYDKEERLFLARDGVAFDGVVSFIVSGRAVVPEKSSYEATRAELVHFFDPPHPLLFTSTMLEMAAHPSAPLFARTLARTLERFVEMIDEAPVDKDLFEMSTKGITWKLAYHTRNEKRVRTPRDVCRIERVCVQAYVSAVPTGLRNFERTELQWFLLHYADKASTRADAERFFALEAGATHAYIAVDEERSVDGMGDDFIVLVRLVFDANAAVTRRVVDAVYARLVRVDTSAAAAAESEHTFKEAMTSSMTPLHAFDVACAVDTDDAPRLDAQ